MKKFLLVANTAWNLYNFRANLILHLQQQGIEVVAVCPNDRFAGELTKRGIRRVEWDVSRKGMKPLHEWQSIRSLTNIYREERPDLVHHFTIKSVLYGTVAAKKCSVPHIVNSVTGLGHMFVSDKLKTRLLRPLIRSWYARSLTGENIRCIFQNRDDVDELARVVPSLKHNSLITNGSGVDLNRFKASPVAENNSDRKIVVVYAGRLIREKGIFEFVDAAKRLRHLPLEFKACGAADFGNPSAVSQVQLEKWKRETSIDFMGHVDRVEKALHQADIVVLPSHREGTPRFLLEAAAMAKPIITCDVPGCREIVSHEREGLLVPHNNPGELAKAIERLAGDHDMRRRMGQNARLKVQNEFNEQEVIDLTWKVYYELLGDSLIQQPSERPEPIEA